MIAFFNHYYMRVKTKSKIGEVVGLVTEKLTKEKEVTIEGHGKACTKTVTIVEILKRKNPDVK